MTNLIKKDDPRYFSQTSDIPYDKHQYRIKFDTGKAIVFPDWDSMIEFWWSSVAA